MTDCLKDNITSLKNTLLTHNILQVLKNTLLTHNISQI